jgi:hypothetical protein
MAIDSIEDEIMFQADFDSASNEGPKFIDLDFSNVTRPEGILDIEIWTDLQHGHGDIIQINLVNDNCGNEATLEAIYGADLIGYVI